MTLEKVELQENPADDSIESFVDENLKNGLTELDRLVDKVEENESANQLSNLGLTRNCMLFLCMGILFSVNTAESILYKYAAYEPILGTTFLAGVPFWFDAIGRVLVLAYFANWTLLTSLPLKPWMVLFGIRVLCQTGYCLGVSSIQFVGAGKKKILEQLQIPIVAGIRYFYMKRKINAAQILFAFAVCCAALGFVFSSENEAEDIEASGVGEGLIMMFISVTFCACAYCCSEYFLQNTLEEATLTIIDKNIMFAIADIPIMIFVLFFDVFCERILQGKPRSWNIFQGMDWYCFALIFNSIIFGLVKYPILDWANSLVLSIVLTLATALTWVVELALPKNRPEFSKSKLAIVCILIIVSIGFQWEGMNREKQKQKRKILVTEERIRVLQRVKKLL